MLFIVLKATLSEMSRALNFTSMQYTILEGRLCPSRLDISSLIYQSVELDIVQRHVQW
jgi:hypothetical protein